MTHVHRTRRVRRDIFDVDSLVAADPRQAIRLAFRQDGAKLAAPHVGRQSDVDEARPGDLDRGDVRQGLDLWGDRPGQRTWVGRGGFREDHRGIGREVAVRRVAGRLDRHGAAVQLHRQDALSLELIEHPVEERGIKCVEAQLVTKSGKAAALAQRRQCVTPACKTGVRPIGPGQSVPFWHELSR